MQKFTKHERLYEPIKIILHWNPYCKDFSAKHRRMHNGTNQARKKDNAM